MKFIIFNLGVIFILCYYVDGKKITFMTTERPKLVYVNEKYFRNANVTSRRHGRADPFYYVDMHGEIIYPVGNNLTLEFFFYEYFNNVYRRSFINFHFTLCEFFTNKFFGAAMLQGKVLDQGCPLPPGDYHWYNMTAPIEHIPPHFPFNKGRIAVNVTGTHTKEYLIFAQFDIEIKSMNIKNRQ